MLEYTLHGSGV